MPIRIVQSKQNPRLKELRKALAYPGRNERCLVAIEGPHLVNEAILAGLRVESIFYGGGAPTVNYEFDKANADIDILLVPGDHLQSILATENPQPVAALIEPPDWTWNHIFRPQKSSAALVIVLAGLQDPGNLGTIIRSADAFGADGVICLPGTVNPWNPKVVRASAGSIFRLPILTGTEDEVLAHFREACVRVLTTSVQGARPATLVDLASPVALIIGNEGNGVPADLAVKADGAITIPFPGPVESLNAAVAASVLLYEAARQRSSKAGKPPERRGGAR
jgi:TrmH family RNA methyltransferase